MVVITREVALWYSISSILPAFWLLGMPLAGSNGIVHRKIRR